MAQTEGSADMSRSEPPPRDGLIIRLKSGKAEMVSG